MKKKISADFQICISVSLKLTITTLKKKSFKQKHCSKQRHVYSTPEKPLDKALDMLQVANKKLNLYLMLTFNRFHILFWGFYR